MKRNKITRRLVLGAGGAGAAGPALARPFRFRGTAGAPPPAPQAITGVGLTSNTFLSGTANAVVGTAFLTLSPASPPASGTVWSLSGGASASFVIDPSTALLSVRATPLGPGPYTFSIVPTNPAYTGSGTAFSVTVTGSPTTLTTNVPTTRPLGAIDGSSGSNDYPFANVIAAVAGGPGNPGDFLQFWNGSSYVGSPWYLNNSSSPPGSGVTTASGLQVPSVQGATWNPAFTLPPTPPITSFDLRFVRGGPLGGSPGDVLAHVPIKIDILKRATVFPVFQQIGLNHTPTIMQTHINSVGTGSGGSSQCPIVAGTIGIDTFFSIESSFVPALNSMTVQYTIDDIPVGGLIVGPASLTMPQWATTINTVSVSWNGGTGIPDGTHALGVILVDATGGAAATSSLPYYFRFIQIAFIVHNTGVTLATLYASPIQIPTIDRGNAPGGRINSSKLDFVTFPGFTAIAGTNGTHNTIVPIPLPQSGTIPPASDPTSPMHGLSAAAQRANTNWFTKGLCGANPTEYIAMQRFFTTVNGGIYAYGYNAEQGQTLEGDYTATIRHFNFDGARNDCIPDQLSSAIPGHDGTYWVVFEMFGRIVKVTFDGTMATMAGGTTDRTKVGLCVDDSNYSESQIDPFLIQVGTIVSPTFGDLRGINLGCWDLTDPVAGNSLLVANPVDHYLAKVTGLAPGHGPVTMFRIAGQDGGIGAAQVNPADNGGMVDGPATEFVTIGTSTIATAPNGSIAGTLFTVGASPTGAFGIGQPLHGSGVAAGTLIISAAGAGTWNVNIAQTVTTRSITGSTPVAQMAGPYSVDMADGIVGPDPKGTLYVADYQNSRVVKIAFDPGSGTWTTASTLFGNQAGTIRWNAAGPFVGSPIGAILSNSPGNTILSATWAAGVLTVVTNAPVVQAGVDSQYGTIQVGWIVSFTGLTNSGSGGNAAVNVNLASNSPSPNFKVASVTDPSHFTVTMPAAAGVIAPTLGGTGAAGPAVVTFYADDVYLPVGAARAINPGGPHEAYIPLPQRAVINSKGNLIISSTWFDAVVTVNLRDPTLGNVPSIVYTGQYGCDQPNTRLATNGGRGRTSLNFQISWFQIDVDRGVAGDVSAIGCVGPKDDIFFADSNGNVMGTYWRQAGDGSFGGDIGSNDMIRWQPMPVGRQGIGHYNWAMAISRHQGRILSSGLSDGGISEWTIINPAWGDFYTDTQSNQNVDGAALQRGYINLLQGTLAGLLTTSMTYPFPWGTRPGIYQTHGEGLRSNLGLPGHADTIDGLQNNYPTDAALTTFLQSGGGGVVPAPEFTGDDLKDIIYTIRRTSAQGSIPGGTAGGGFTAINPLVQRAPYETDVTAPVISAVSATRNGGAPTTITVTWTTDKPTWGVLAAGFASAHGTTVPYHLFAREPFVAGAGNPSYGTSHSATIQCFKDAITYLAVIAKDIPGNNAISPEQTVAA